MFVFMIMIVVMVVVLVAWWLTLLFFSIVRIYIYELRSVTARKEIPPISTGYCLVSLLTAGAAGASCGRFAAGRHLQRWSRHGALGAGAKQKPGGFLCVAVALELPVGV